MRPSATTSLRWSNRNAAFRVRTTVTCGWSASQQTARFTSSADAFFGGEKIWQSFSDWLAKVPSVNYGIFTNEVDAAVAAQLPALAKGGSVDEAVKAIDAQVKTQMQ